MTFSAYIMAWNAAAIICLVVGIALWILEMFTPGLGVPALLGSISLLAAIVLSARSFSHAMITLALILILLGVCAFFVFRAFSHGKLHRIVLHESMNGDSTPLMGMMDMVGKEGVCLTTLRPAGDADFDGQRLDVVSEGDFIEKGSKVRIDRIEGLRIIVKRV
ncbi:MAG: NfeD family protein [Clostridia bacterium]|nr:NfeD family protein [Clostridia bacterium]